MNKTVKKFYKKGFPECIFMIYPKDKRVYS